MVVIKGEKKVRLEEIWKLHKEGKSTREITEWMNEKYRTTLRTPRPYYTTLIWETLKKLKIREKRLSEYFESYEDVRFLRIEEIIKREPLPNNLITEKTKFPTLRPSY